MAEWREVSYSWAGGFDQVLGSQRAQSELNQVRPATLVAGDCAAEALAGETILNASAQHAAPLQATWMDDRPPLTASQAIYAARDEPSVLTEANRIKARGAQYTTTPLSVTLARCASRFRAAGGTRGVTLYVGMLRTYAPPPFLFRLHPLGIACNWLLSAASIGLVPRTLRLQQCK